MKIAKVAVNRNGRTTYAASGTTGATPFSSVLINHKSPLSISSYLYYVTFLVTL
jgi:hypothetical protein